MTRRVYFTTSNNGDGSSSVHFYDSQECIERLEEADPEGYSQGEGGGWFVIEGDITGITVDTMADVEQYISDMDFDDDQDT